MVAGRGCRTVASASEATRRRSRARRWMSTPPGWSAACSGGPSGSASPGGRVVLSDLAVKSSGGVHEGIGARAAGGRGRPRRAPSGRSKSTVGRGVDRQARHGKLSPSRSVAMRAHPSAHITFPDASRSTMAGTVVTLNLSTRVRPTTPSYGTANQSYNSPK